MTDHDLHPRATASRMAAITVLLAALVMTAGFAQPTTDTLSIRYRGDISQLDPRRHSSLHDIGMADNIYSQLLRFIPGTAELIPDLATHWEISDDGLVYTFHLREGVQWHRGYGEVTAEDVKWTYETMLSGDFPSTGQFRFGMMDRVEAPDPYLVEIHLSEPHGPLLNKLGYPWNTGIVNRQAIEEFGADYTSHAIGSGPYMLESWTPNSEIVLVANPDYFEEGLPRTGRIVLVPIADDAVAAGPLGTGELVLGLFRDPDAVAALEANPNLVVDRGTQSAVSSLFYRMDRPPFEDLRVRQAVHHAIDKDTLLDTVLSGVATVAHTLVSPLADGSAEDSVVRYEYDPERARQLLTEAGYPDGFEVTLLTTQLEPWPLVSPILQFYLEEVGIRVDYRQLEHGTYGAERNNANYDMVVLTVTGPPDPDTWMQLVHSDNVPPGNNVSFYANQEVDLLIEQATATVDPAARADLYRQVQEQALEDAALVPIFHLGVQVIRRADVQGFDVPIAHDFPLKNVYIGSE
jgi:peptide/nickel transport system substrate-binding protein